VHAETLKHTIFMKQGRCSKYPGVTHQYTVLKESPLPFAPGQVCSSESGRMMNGKLEGSVLASFPVDSYEACCHKASQTAGQAFVLNGSTCNVLRNAFHYEQVEGVSSGWTVQYFNESDVVDLYSYSCLNGWTMGNIAFAAVDAVKLWHALLVSKTMVKPESLELMKSWGAMSHGWGAGMEYGSGLMKLDVGKGLRVKGKCPQPLCVCQYNQCRLNATLIGHMGADWGSSMPFNGHIPQLGASVAVAMTATFRGMNSSLSIHENSGLQGVLKCHMLQILYQHQHPGFPDLMCPPLENKMPLGSSLIV